MKKSRIHNLIFGVCLLFQSQSILSQSCTIDYIDPYSHEFPIEGGSIYVTVHTYPYNCGPSLSFPSWLNMYQVSDETYIVECDPNSGSSRSIDIIVGNDYLFIHQLGDPLDGGTIGGPNSEFELSICYNTSPGILTNQMSASGGDCSIYDYQWQISSDGTNFTDLQYATEITYTPAAQISDKYYRRKVTCYGVESFSNQVYVHVLELNPGSIGSDQTINYNSSPSTLTNISSATGSYQLLYQWQKSIDEGNNWTDIPAANNSTFSPGTMQSSTVFRRKVSDYNNPNCAVYSNLDTIKVIQWSSPDLTKNFVYLKEPLIETDKIENLTEVEEVRGTIKYYDGLGREIQNIQMSASPDQNDIVTPLKYDEFGRETIKYLPFKATNNLGNFVPNPFSNQQTYYSTQFPSNIAYAKTVYENSPSNRILEQGAPGKPWQPFDSLITGSGHTTKYLYETNGANEVIKWQIIDDVLNKNGYYSANTLYKLITKDENWEISNGVVHTIEEFKNFQGEVVLKRSYISATIKLETFYVYDDFGLLRYVLSPEAIANIGTSTTFNSSTPLIEDLCYYYKYNNKHLLSKKQLPGADPIYYIYDKRGRLILTQDGNYRVANNKKWLFTKYDNLNRPILMGDYFYEGSTELDEIGMQSYIDGLDYQLFDSYSEGSNNVFYYTNISFPFVTNSDNVLTVTYYDNYDFDNDVPNKIKTYNTYMGYCTSVYNSDFPTSKIYYNTTGRITGTKTRVLNRDVAITGEAMPLTLNLYDSKDRIIRSLSINHMGGEDLILSKYDFIGTLVNSLQIHRLKSATSPAEVKLAKTYSYDQSGRLNYIDQEIFYDGLSKGTTRVLGNSYNDLGQLISKSTFASGNPNILLQTIDYSYNIRGWLTSINNGELNNNDLFGMSINYETIPGGTGAPLSDSQFNGNISAIQWKSSGDNVYSCYGFKYDEINRLISSDFANKNSSGIWDNQKSFDEKDLTFDKNGNILTLKRYGVSSNLIDSLTYSYGTSNALQSIIDTKGNYNVGDYPGALNQSNSYSYDKNGNLKTDNAKGITNIAYNYINLPNTITFGSYGTLDYTYYVAGAKLRMKTTSGGTTSYRHYIGGFEYDETTQGTYTLSLIHTEEGIVEYDSSNLKYKPFIKDHLGNTRIVVNYQNGQPNAFQKNNYYPFGLLFPGDNNDGIKYLYNGKEIQDKVFNSISLDWYDYGARFYDPQIGRWNVVDAKSEKYSSWSPYNYCMNNPILLIDLNGNDWYQSNDGAVFWRNSSDKQIIYQDVSYKNIGTTYTQKLGNATYSFEQNKIVKINENVISGSGYISEYKSDANNNPILGADGRPTKTIQCYDASFKMAENSGAQPLGGFGNSQISTASESGTADNRSINPIKNARNGVVYIENEIGSGRAVVAGVDYKFGYSNDKQYGDFTTDHYITIKSVTYDLKTSTTSFGYYDPGTFTKGQGISSGNVLKVSGNSLMVGQAAISTRPLNYTVTSIQRNR